MTSPYDVHIGKLISGKRGLEGDGSFLLCTPGKEIAELASYSPNDGAFVGSRDVEDALYEFCLSAMNDYIADGNNKEVYAFSIYTDTYIGSYVVTSTIWRP